MTNLKHVLLSLITLSTLSCEESNPAQNGALAEKTGSKATSILTATSFTSNRGSEAIALEVAEQLKRTELSLSSEERSTKKTVLEPSSIQLPDGSIVSFTQEPVVNPRIILEMVGWVSDLEPVITSIDLEGAQESNQLFINKIGPTEESSGQRDAVRITNSDGPGNIQIYYRNDDSDSLFSSEHFYYTWVGKTPTGVHVLKCWHRTGGSGVWCYVIFVRPELRAIGTYMSDANTLEIIKGQRVQLSKVGAIFTGDRYDGDVTLHGNILTIGGSSGKVPNRPKSEDRHITLGF